MEEVEEEAVNMHVYAVGGGGRAGEGAGKCAWVNYGEEDVNVHGYAMRRRWLMCTTTMMKTMNDEGTKP